MPKTTKQRNTARMAKGVRSGSLKMKDVPPGARKSVKSMKSMSDKDLHKFATGKIEGKKKKVAKRSRRR